MYDELFSFLIENNGCVKLAWDSQLGMSILPKSNRYFPIHYHDGINRISNSILQTPSQLHTPENDIDITKTCLYNFDPIKPHFYIVKLGFTGVYIIFLISAQSIDCGYSLEPPRWGGSNEYPQSMFWAETWKISEFLIWKFSFFGGKIFNIFE